MCTNVFRDSELQLKWRIAIKRATDRSGLGAPWQPKPKTDRVCKDHFTKDDFRTTVTGK